MAWGPLAGAAAGVGAVVAGIRPWDGNELTLWSLRVIVFLGALGAAYAVEDPMATITAASPTALGRRRAVRVGLALLALGFVVGAACGVIAAFGGTGPLPWGRALLESAGVVAFALACTAVVGADRATVLVAGGFVGAVVLEQKFPAYALFPTDPGAEAWTRAGTAWAVVLVVSVLWLCARSRDPAGLSRRRRGGAARRGGLRLSCRPAR